MSNDKFYTLEKAIQILRDNKEIIFEIREKNSFYESLLLICVKNMSGFYDLNFWTKPYKTMIPYKWTEQDYIPFSKNIKWYISQLTKKDVQKSIDEIGVV